jgi:multidrug resistance protein
MDKTEVKTTSSQGISQPQEEHNNADTVAATQPAKLYSIYNRHEKWALVTIAGVAGLFSPLPANIYFPAIPSLATAFDRTIEDMNLTVTIYLAMQGCSPMLWGPLSDRFGRRPIFLLCLTILIGSSLGLALCPVTSFWLLLLLRALQAGGCASTIALGAGVIGDIASVDERGGFFGMFNLGPMLAPCLGPAVGGVLSEHLGWRSIFWFLTIFSVVCFGMILLLLPETMRGMVGNGSLRPPHRIHRPILPLISGRLNTRRSEKPHEELTTTLSTDSSDGVKTKLRTNPFRLLIYPDVILTLTFTGIVYAVNYTIMSTISSTFASSYPYLSETMIGLCYLSTGLGMLLGSTVAGKLLDLDFARIKKSLVASQETDGSANVDEKDDASFPIEYARLRLVPVLLVVFVACTVGWGWCIQAGASLAGPLVLQVACKSLNPAAGFPFISLT